MCIILTEQKIMLFHLYDWYCPALVQKPLPRGKAIYNFGTPYLGHHYYTLSFLWSICRYLITECRSNNSRTSCLVNVFDQFINIKEYLLLAIFVLPGFALLFMLFFCYIWYSIMLFPFIKWLLIYMFTLFAYYDEDYRDADFNWKKVNTD